MPWNSTFIPPVRFPDQALNPPETFLWQVSLTGANGDYPVAWELFVCDTGDTKLDSWERNWKFQVRNTPKKVEEGIRTKRLAKRVLDSGKLLNPRLAFTAVNSMGYNFCTKVRVLGLAHLNWMEKQNWKSCYFLAQGRVAVSVQKIKFGLKTELP